jgi:hypothetical protein
MRRTHLWVGSLGLALATACADGPRAPLAPVTGSGVQGGVVLERNGESGQLVAAGDYRTSVPPDVFGTTTPIIAHFSFQARATSGGGATGWYYVVEAYDGAAYHYRGTFTCFGDYDFNGATGNRAKIGGIVTESDDPTSPVGSYLWWQAIDNRRAVPRIADQTTLVGGGDNAANAAFCASNAPPRFGPFSVDGDLDVGPGETE